MNSAALHAVAFYVVVLATLICAGLGPRRRDARLRSAGRLFGPFGRLARDRGR